jgi:hypothetical protein
MPEPHPEVDRILVFCRILERLARRAGFILASSARNVAFD